MCNRQPVGPDLLEFLDPAPQSVHLDALMAVLGLQLRDGLFLLGAVELDLLQGGTHRAQLLLQGRHMLLLLTENKGGCKDDGEQLTIFHQDNPLSINTVFQRIPGSH